MGYRSNVYIYLVEGEYLKEKDLTLEQVIKGAQEKEEFDESCFEIVTNKDGNRVLRFHEVYLKWYSEFPIVEYWDTLLGDMMDKDYDNEFLSAVEGEDGKFEYAGEYGEVYQTLVFDVDFGEDKDGDK